MAPRQAIRHWPHISPPPEDVLFDVSLDDEDDYDVVTVEDEDFYDVEHIDGIQSLVEYVQAMRPDLQVHEFRAPIPEEVLDSIPPHVRRARYLLLVVGAHPGSGFRNVAFHRRSSPPPRGADYALAPVASRGRYPDILYHAGLVRRPAPHPGRRPRRRPARLSTPPAQVLMPPSPTLWPRDRGLRHHPWSL